MTSGDALTFKILTKDMKEVLTRSVVRPADDMKSRNRRVKFNDDVENKFKKMDPNTKKYIHRKHLITLSDTKQDNDSEKDEGGITTGTRSGSYTEQAVSTRTRSKFQVVNALNTTSIRLIENAKGGNFSHWLSIPSANLFILSQVYFWVPGKPPLLCLPITSMSYKDAVMNSTPNHMQQLKYLNICDSIEDQKEDPWNTVDLGNNHIWAIEKIIGHRSRGEITEFKVQWQNPNQETT